MADANKISKAKGVQIVADLLYAGKSRKEIVQILTESYKVSEGAVDKWLKEARTIVSERHVADEATRTQANAAAIAEAAKSLNISKERIMERLAQIAFGDIRQIFTADGGLKSIPDWEDETAGMVAGIESYDEKVKGSTETQGTNRKVKVYSPLEAITILNRMLGYNAPDKVQSQTIGKDGKPVDPTPIVEHRVIIKDMSGGHYTTELPGEGL